MVRYAAPRRKGTETVFKPLSKADIRKIKRGMK